MFSSFCSVNHKKWYHMSKSHMETTASSHCPCCPSSILVVTLSLICLHWCWAIVLLKWFVLHQPICFSGPELELACNHLKPCFYLCSSIQSSRSRSRRDKPGPVSMGPPPPPKAQPSKAVTDSTFLEKLHAVEEELAVCMKPYQVTTTF